MSIIPPVHLIVWPDFYCVPCNLAALADSRIPVSVLLPQSRKSICQQPADNCLDFVQLNPNETWQQAAYKIAQKSRSKYLFFLASSQQFEPGAIPQLLDGLQSDPLAAGISPIFLGQESGKVLKYGLVADSQHYLHYLYSGLAANHPLILKKHYFQTANGSALLLMRDDFLAAKGFGQQPELAFLTLGLRIHAQTRKFFTTSPSVRIPCTDFSHDLYSIGHWNSWALRGKLPSSSIQADYFAITREDGINGTVTNWLNETIENNGLWDENDAQIAWLLDPNPATLLKYLNNLAPEAQTSIFNLCKLLPTFLPLQFHYYEVLAARQLQFAKKYNFPLLEQAVLTWQKRRHRFHHSLLKPSMKALQKAGFYNASLDLCPGSYDAWLELSPEQETLTIADNWPKLSVIMPVYDPKPKFLRQAIESVREQTYANFELCIADDASANPEIKKILIDFSQLDERIKIKFRSKNGHIAEASNTALKLATGEYSVFMDHDDKLAKTALAEIAKMAADNPQLAIICTDEDNITEDNIRRSPNFRILPDLHMRGHLFAYKTDLLRQVGGLRSEVNGAQDYDLNLRIMRNFPQTEVGHIAKILYHWRIHAESTAGSSQSKPYIFEATKKTIHENCVAKYGKCETVGTAIPYAFNSFYELPKIFSGLIIVLDDGNEPDSALMAMLAYQKDKYKIPQITISIQQNWQSAFIAAAQTVEAANLLFVHGQLRPLEACKPEQLLFLASRPEFAAVGSYLYNGELLWHGGLYPNSNGQPFPLLKNIPKNQLVFCDKANFLFNHYALAPAFQCLAIRRELLLQENALEEEMGVWTMANYALRQAQKGRGVLYSPWGQWQWTKAPEWQDPAMVENQLFLAKWANAVKANTLRNANLQAAPDNNWMLKFG